MSSINQQEQHQSNHYTLNAVNSAQSSGDTSLAGGNGHDLDLRG